MRTFERTSLDDILKTLETACRERTACAIPDADLLLLHRAGCFPEADGLYHFRAAGLRRVSRCPGYERAIAFLILIALSPLLLAIALAILACDGSPVLFRQQRTGFSQQPRRAAADSAPRQFAIVKFRTMSASSKSERDALARQAPRDRTFKLADDPRVTRLGAWLRRHYLDELPQLWNVVRGEMRLFGPRPLPASDHGLYRRPGQSLRLLGLPGISGLWQTFPDRSQLTFDEMCLLDWYFLTHDAFRLRLRLFGKTLSLVFKRAH